MRSTSPAPSDVAGKFPSDSPPFPCLVRWSCCRSASLVPNLLPVGQRTGGPERNDRHVVVACHLVHRRLTCSPVKPPNRYKWGSAVDYSTSVVYTMVRKLHLGTTGHFRHSRGRAVAVRLYDSLCLLSVTGAIFMWFKKVGTKIFVASEAPFRAKSGRITSIID